jgi:hypothetical protein
MTSPSEIKIKFTYDLLDFLPILFDEFEGKDSDCYDSVVFGDDSLVYFGKTSFPEKV